MGRYTLRLVQRVDLMSESRCLRSYSNPHRWKLGIERMHPQDLRSATRLQIRVDHD